MGSSPKRGEMDTASRGGQDAGSPGATVRLWPVTADERVRGWTIILGAGERGLALAADAGAIVRALGASVAEISDPEPAA